MNKFIISLMFIPIILLFAFFLLLQLGTHSSDPDTSWITHWHYFKRTWMTSTPLYGLVFTTIAYSILLIKKPKKTIE